MDYEFEVIGNEEYERRRGLYGPLSDAIRKLIAAGIRTEADDDAVRDALTAIESATELLQRRARTATVALRHEDTGQPVVWSNPAVGLRNAVAPPMIVRHEDDGRCVSEFTLDHVYEGPPGWVHGGICALLLDHILGEAASEGLTQMMFTGTITLRYLRGTPLGSLRAEAFIERTEGVKTFARGYLGDDDGPTVEAEGVFVRPAWARDAG